MEFDSVAGQTLSLLEQRLQRLEFLLTGEAAGDEPPTSDPPAVQRVQRLQRELNKLAVRYPHIGDLMRIRECGCIDGL
jgi:hypothetical protein